MLKAPKQDRYVEPLEVVYKNFSGGLDAFTDRINIPQGTAWFTENCWPRKRILDTNSYSGICTRPGLIRFLENPLGVGAGNMLSIVYVSTTVAATFNWIFVLMSNGAIYKTKFPNAAAWTLVTTIAGATEMRATSASGQGIFCVYGPGGVGGMFVFDGVTWANIVGAPAGRYIVYHRNRVFVAGMDSSPWRLAYSDFRAPTLYPSVNIIDDMDDDTGWQITGVISFRSSLIITTGIRIWQLAGSSPADYSLYKINEAVGCSAPDTLKTDGDSIYFLSNRGFIRWDTSGEPEYISRLVWPFIRFDYDANFANRAVAAYHDWAYYTCYRSFGGTYNDRGLNYDLNGGGWYPTGVDTFRFSSMLSVENGLYLLAGDAVNGRLYLVDTTPDDDGVPIVPEWRTADENFGLPHIPKMLNRVDILAEVDADAESAPDGLLDLKVYRDMSTVGESLLTQPTVDIYLGGDATQAGCHDQAGGPAHNRSIVLFRAGIDPIAPQFNTVSIGLKRNNSRSHMNIMMIRLIAYPNATQQ